MAVRGFLISCATVAESCPSEAILADLTNSSFILRAMKKPIIPPKQRFPIIVSQIIAVILNKFFFEDVYAFAIIISLTKSKSSHFWYRESTLFFISLARILLASKILLV